MRAARGIITVLTEDENDNPDGNDKVDHNFTQGAIPEKGMIAAESQEQGGGNEHGYGLESGAVVGHNSFSMLDVEVPVTFK